MSIANEIEKVHKAPADTEIRICRRMEVGGVIHQGDVYIHRVADDHPRGDVLGTRKLAIGQGAGSNHMAEGSQIEIFRGEKLPPWVRFENARLHQEALGPLVVARESWLVTHPTHAHHQLPAGAWQVTYQIDMATARRVMD